MKKNKVKWIALMMVLVLTMSCLSACGGGDSEDADTEDVQDGTEGTEGTDDTEGTTAPDESGGESAAPEEEASSKEKLTFDDLGGMEILIGDWWTVEDAEITNAYQEDTEAYRQEIMERYNFKMDRKPVASWGDMPEVFTASTLNNDPIADIVYIYQTHVSKPLQAGLFYDLGSLQAFDFSEEKWNKKVTDLMSVGDGVYGMQTEQEPRGGIFYNQRLFEEAGIPREEPYDLQASGEWTWEKFAEYCKKLTVDRDGDGVTDTYAMANFSKDYYKLCVASNGALFVGKNEDGTYFNATDDPKFMEGIQWGTQFLIDKYIMPKPEGANWDWFIAAYRDCEVAMQIAEVYQTTYWSTMEDPYGFVLFPAGPNGKMVTCPMDNIIVIPACKSAEEAEKLAFAYDQYTELTPGYTVEDTWKNHYYPQFTDTRAVDETLALMRDPENQVIDYLPLIVGMDYGDFAYSVYALGKTAQEQLEEINPVWNKLIDDMNKKSEG